MNLHRRQRKSSILSRGFIDTFENQHFSFSFPLGSLWSPLGLTVKERSASVRAATRGRDAATKVVR